MSIPHLLNIGDQGYFGYQTTKYKIILEFWSLDGNLVENLWLQMSLKCGNHVGIPPLKYR